MLDKSQSCDESTAQWNGRYHARWGDETGLYEAVTTGVSTVSGEARSAVASQYDKVHAFTLSQLFAGADEQQMPSTGVVKFLICECVVSVHSDGQLSISLADDGSDAID